MTTLMRSPGAKVYRTGRLGWGIPRSGTAQLRSGLGMPVSGMALRLALGLALGITLGVMNGVGLGIAFGIVLGVFGEDELNTGFVG